MKTYRTVVVGIYTFERDVCARNVEDAATLAIEGCPEVCGMKPLHVDVKGEDGRTIVATLAPELAREER